MGKIYIKATSTHQLLKEILMGQLRQEHELRILRKCLKKQQKSMQNIHPTFDPHPAPTERNNLGTTTQEQVTSTGAIDNSARRRKKRRRHRSMSTVDTEAPAGSPAIVLSTANSASATPSGDNEHDDDDDSDGDYNEDDDDVNSNRIPWPGHCHRGRYIRTALSKIANDAVVTSLQQYLVPHVILGPNDDHAVSTNHVNQQSRALNMFRYIYNAARTVCRQEPAQGPLTKSYYKLTRTMASRLLQQLERKMDQEGIRIGRAEDQWLSKFFITRALKNKTSQLYPRRNKRPRQREN